MCPMRPQTMPRCSGVSSRFSASGVLGRVLRVVARQADDRDRRQFALDLRQTALVRREPGRWPIDGLREQLLVDRLAVGIERAHSDAFRGGELILFDQRTDALPGGNAAVGKQRFGQREAAFAGGVARIGEELARFACKELRLLVDSAAVARQCDVATQLTVVLAPYELCRFLIEAGEVAACGECHGPVEPQPVGKVAIGIPGEERRDVGADRGIVLAQTRHELPVLHVRRQWMRGKPGRELREPITVAEARGIAGVQERLVVRGNRGFGSSGGALGGRRRGGAGDRRRECQRDGRIDCKSSRQHRTELDHAISAAGRETRPQSRDSSPCSGRCPGGALIG